VVSKSRQSKSNPQRKLCLVPLGGRGPARAPASDRPLCAATEVAPHLKYRKVRSTDFFGGKLMSRTASQLRTQARRLDRVYLQMANLVRIMRDEAALYLQFRASGPVWWLTNGRQCPRIHRPQSHVKSYTSVFRTVQSQRSAWALGYARRRGWQACPARTTRRRKRPDCAPSDLLDAGAGGWSGADMKTAARAETPALSASSQTSFAWLVWEREFRAPPTDIESPGNRQRAARRRSAVQGRPAWPTPCRGLDLMSRVLRSQCSTPTCVYVRNVTA
jgi:hypothetical protein